ncbi:hypothetical protein [Azospirillum melinis]|uniref:hypothetical protein n=1 Tax=Azospirillum melinis TaxID=328839 RepID=UPI00157A83E5|nr:hypothetical protein [Azospirillum melinis]MBP2306282.1 hypothetical protein [Azospirillum melinis]
MQTYSVIQHADGQAFYQGEALTLADAQVLLNDAIADGRVDVGSCLRVEPNILIIDPPL